jgi:hypothetical protein
LFQKLMNTFSETQADKAATRGSEGIDELHQPAPASPSPMLEPLLRLLRRASCLLEPCKFFGMGRKKSNPTPTV